MAKPRFTMVVLLIEDLARSLAFVTDFEPTCAWSTIRTATPS
jgi:hypothetical protein